MGLDGMSIGKNCFKKIREILPEGSTILELGSGEGTDELLKHYRVISIEHNEKYVSHKGKYIHICIYAPIKDYVMKAKKIYNEKGWYDVSVVTNALQQLEGKYDLILVDGPNGSIGRGGFLKFFSIFKQDVPIIIDDVHDNRYLDMTSKITLKLKVGFKVFTDYRKQFAIIYNNTQEK